MSLTKRLAKLEKAEIFSSARPGLTRLEAALNDASLRLTGKLFDAVSGDEATEKLIWNDLQERFIRELSVADLESLISEFEQIAFKGDTAARDAARGMAVSEGIESPWGT
jgi:hypothetical protein